VSDPNKKDKLTHELRILLASLLSIVVILLWVKYFAPKPPIVPPQANKPAQTAPAPSTPGASSSNATLPQGTATGISGPPAVRVPAKSEPRERNIVVENDLYRVEFSNRGGVVKSWQLKKYMDDAKVPQVLDVVHTDAAQQTGGWPLAVSLDDEQLESAANGGLYQVSSSATVLHAPADIEFSWSDGRLEITKKLHFDHSYVVRIELTATMNGAPLTAGVAWLGGFGDLTVANPAPIETVSIVYNENGGKLTAIAAKKLDGPEKWGRGVWQGGKDWTGIQDRYFAAVFLPVNGGASGALETRYWKVSRTVKGADGKDTEEPVPQIATAISAQPESLRLYVGPKDYDDLKKMNPPLNSLLSFGWLEFISAPLFHGLKWLHDYIPNWGWAVVVLTLVINMLLFPLRISSYRTSLKMQRVAPMVKPLNDKMKKYPLNDPRRAEIQKEVMAIYQREGVNLGGGCLQMVVQLPIWYGLNRVLQGAIEMRHAPWFGWIHDLSAKDPLYILPVVMALTMYISTKMTPMATTDPQQQAMMKIMPITMAGMFVILPISSGLAVYILTSSLVGIVQQWWLNRTHPMPTAGNKESQAKPARGKNKKS
jgi:YidC/Oxa1 family membrane protein insertase